jgi:alkaline phosphatase D
MGWAPRTEAIAVERSLVESMAHLQWCELDSHGYLVVDVDRERIRVEWWFVDTVLERTSGERLGGAWEVRHGRPRLIRG